MDVPVNNERSDLVMGIYIIEAALSDDSDYVVTIRPEDNPPWHDMILGGAMDRRDALKVVEWLRHGGLRSIVEEVKDKKYKVLAEEALRWVKQLAFIIGPDFDGTWDLRSTSKHVSNWLAQMRCDYSELEVLRYP